MMIQTLDIQYANAYVRNLHSQMLYVNIYIRRCEYSDVNIYIRRCEYSDVNIYIRRCEYSDVKIYILEDVNIVM